MLMHALQRTYWLVQRARTVWVLRGHSATCTMPVGCCVMVRTHGSEGDVASTGGAKPGPKPAQVRNCGRTTQEKNKSSDMCWI